jgi:hypothetical protein
MIVMAVGVMELCFEDWSLGTVGVLVGWRFCYTYPLHYNIDDGYPAAGASGLIYSHSFQILGLGCVYKSYTRHVVQYSGCPKVCRITVHKI